MRIPLLLAAAGAATMLISCGSEPKAAAPEPSTTAAVKPPDETRRFPMANRVDTQVIDNHLLDKQFMPGGTLARYKQGQKEYSMFIAKLGNAQDAAFRLLDWNKALAGSKIEPAFGGYFGQDGGGPVFVFAKGAWLAGVAGLPEKDADLAARSLAAHLD
ncbi:MAG TPA: hypothetical protein VKR61_07630 [Bryobacteraceae bacterium]|nr:hypothetical protein [Bryobacteraceae bacterium]